MGELNEMRGGIRRTRRQNKHHGDWCGILLAMTGTSLASCWRGREWQMGPGGKNWKTMEVLEFEPQGGAMGMSHLDPLVWINW